MNKSDWLLKKLTSRKFILSLAAFLGSLGMSIAGMRCENETVAAVGIVCSVISAALYAGAEAYCDSKRAEFPEDKEE